MIKTDGNDVFWSPEVHHWSPPEDVEATAKKLNILRDAVRQAESRELAALAELDEVNAKLRELSGKPKVTR